MTPKKKPVIKTLAMLKMEKNFIAHMEKGNPRHPYIYFSIDYFIERLVDEVLELFEAYYQHKGSNAMKKECADISNIIDFVFEKLCNEG